MFEDLEDQENLEQPSLFVRIFGTFGNICTLNVLWIIFSLPIVTAGASTTALYSVMLKLIKNEEGGIWKSFTTAFKKNFKKATIAWLIVLAAAIIIYVEMIYGWSFDGMLPRIYMVIAIIEAVLLAMVLAFLFPLIARYDNSLKNTFKNAFLLSVSNMGSFLKIFCAWVMPLYLSSIPAVFLYTWWLWLICIVGFIAYGTSFTVRSVFARIEQVQSEKEEEEGKEKQGGTTGLKKLFSKNKKEPRKPGSLSSRAQSVTAMKQRQQEENKTAPETDNGGATAADTASEIDNGEQPVSQEELN